MISVLEIGTEELPAGFLLYLNKSLKNIADKIKDNMFISYDDVKIFLTPRRIIIILENVMRIKDEIYEKFRGPKIDIAFKNNEPTKALLGFLKSKQASIDDIIKRDGYIYIERTKKIKPLKELLGDFYLEVFSSISLPKSMFWNNKSNRFLRPIRWVIALLGDEIIDLNIAGINASRESFGHRLLKNKKFDIKDADSYLELLKQNNIMYDQIERFNLIKDEVERLNGVINDSLIWENVMLVEYPFIFKGELPPKAMDLPAEVIETVLRKHQKSFVCKSNGKLESAFIAVSNNKVTDKIKTGHERVIRARLYDAIFFFDEDSKLALKERLEGLKDIVFYSNLGTLYQKAERVSKIAEYLNNLIFKDYKFQGDFFETAGLLKADLLTEMVYEFPELQGIAGSFYLKNEGYPEDVYMAVKEHYLPKGADDNLPVTKSGVLWALSDKIDTLCTFFMGNIIPASSKDPFALRRMAIGLIKIIINNDISISIKNVIEFVYNLLNNQGMVVKDNQGTLLDFLKERMFYMLKGEFDYDIIDSVIAVTFDDIYDVYLRIKALRDMRKSNEFKEFVHLALRVNNILKDVEFNVECKKELFKEPEEIALYNTYKKYEDLIIEHIRDRKYVEVFKLFLNFKGVLTNFFDKILINTDNKEIRENRKALLQSYRNMFLNLFLVDKITDK